VLQSRQTEQPQEQAGTAVRVPSSYARKNLGPLFVLRPICVAHHHISTCSALHICSEIIVKRDYAPAGTLVWVASGVGGQSRVSTATGKPRGARSACRPGGVRDVVVPAVIEA
jgi:hypothetical protein